MRIDLAVDLVMNRVAGGSYSELARGIHNGLVSVDQGRKYVTQRPSIDWIEDCSAVPVTDVQGRGIYYWPLSGHRYFVNYDTIYKDDYSTVIGSITAGTRRVYFFELDTYLILVDWENDEAWTITTGDVVTEITDTEFPPKDTPAVSLAHGGAVLNSIFYVLGADGIIYNSAADDPTAWAAGDFVGASRDPDGGSYLGKHHDYLVAMGPASMEFFQDAGNASGSPLNRSEAYFYTLGLADGGSVWENDDLLFFIGADQSGGLQVFVLENFVPRAISSPAMGSLLTTAINADNYVVSGSGFEAFGHLFYILTMSVETTYLAPEITYVYDYTAGLWYTWESTYKSTIAFPIMQWTRRKSTGARRGEGILITGDIVTLVDDISPSDTIGGTGGYVTSGYVVDGYVGEGGYEGQGFELVIRTGQDDLGTRDRKTCTYAKMMADVTPNSAEGTLKWANEASRNFNAGRTLDLAYDRCLTSLGSYYRRNWEFSITTTDVVRLEALEIDVELEA